MLLLLLTLFLFQLSNSHTFFPCCSPSTKARVNMVHGEHDVMVCTYMLLHTVHPQFRCAPLCIRHIVTWAIEFLVSHYNQLFSVNNRAVVTEMYRICAVIYGICMQIVKENDPNNICWVAVQCGCAISLFLCLFVGVCVCGIVSSLIDSKIKCCCSFCQTQAWNCLTCVLFEHEHRCKWKQMKNKPKFTIYTQCSTLTLYVVPSVFPRSLSLSYPRSISYVYNVTFG